MQSSRSSRRRYRRRSCPGAVILVGRGDRNIYEKAIGNRSLVPSVEPMSHRHHVRPRVADEGRRHDDERDDARRARKDSPQRSRRGVHPRLRALRQGRHHHPPPHDPRLGPAAGRRLGEAWTGSDTAIEPGDRRSPDEPAGPALRLQRHQLLSARRHRSPRVSGMPLDDVRQARDFRSARHEGHDVPAAAALRPRIAPTEKLHAPRWPCEGAERQMLRGVVHDPTARRMGGVAGHAGLFSTAADLAIFCRMLLGGGASNGARILSPLAVEKMTSPAIGDDPNVRGLGWDIDSSYSSNRGELLPVGSFGHTGFTGTSLWIDPVHRPLRRLPVEPCPPRRQRGRDAASGACRHAGRGVAARRAAALPRRPSGPGATSGRPARCCRLRRVSPVDDRPRRAARDSSSRRLRGSASASSPTTPAWQATAATAIDLFHDAKNVKLVVALQARTWHPRRARRQRADRDRSRRPACRSIRCTATRAARRPTCSRGSTRS